MAPPGVDECHVALMLVLLQLTEKGFLFAARSGCKAANLPTAAEVREAVPRSVRSFK
jgi:hypothetical protein